MIMPFEEESILDWLEDSISYLPTIFDDPYAGVSGVDLSSDSWWVQPQDWDTELINANNSPVSFNCNSTVTTSTGGGDAIVCGEKLCSNKRKGSPLEESGPKGRRNQSRRSKGGEDGDVVVRKSGGNRRAAARSAGNNGVNGRDGRWAEQLLNPCAAAITAGNLTRVQHLLYVLHELASPAGDANHRLAAHGLRALTHHLSSCSGIGAAPVFAGGITYATAEPKFFQKTLMDFNEISPWFAIPNKITNSSILQILQQQEGHRKLHIVDIGVSHGVQWPTLLEELSRRPGGPPPLVRLTIISSSADIVQTDGAPFAIGPINYNYSSRLLNFAKDININLQIKQIENNPFQNLNSDLINSSPDETLIVCTQFRLHHLNHNRPDERTEYLKALRRLNPKGVILSENDVDCGCFSCGDFASGFSRRVEHLWKFLDSTSAAFKGRESDQRRMMEGEAAKGLVGCGGMNDRREKWCEMMRGVGFSGDAFGEDAIDGARALLRKYDSNWEMKVDDRDRCVELWWKGQTVSFCSLWKLDIKEIVSS